MKIESKIKSVWLGETVFNCLEIGQGLNTTKLFISKPNSPNYSGNIPVFLFANYVNGKYVCNGIWANTSQQQLDSIQDFFKFDFKEYEDYLKLHQKYKDFK